MKKQWRKKKMKPKISFETIKHNENLDNWKEKWKKKKKILEIHIKE